MCGSSSARVEPSRIGTRLNPFSGHVSFVESARRRLYDRRHRSFATRDERIGAESMDLVALQLGVLQVRGGDDDPTGGMHLHSHPVALLQRMLKERVEHVDHVLE